MTDQTFDIIVYGATSFVGQIMTRYMQAQFADGSIRWAIAGRSKSKLETLSREAGLTGRHPSRHRIQDTKDHFT